MTDYSSSQLPPHTISDAARDRLIWVSVQEQVSYTDAVDILTDYYCVADKEGHSLDDLYSITKLSRELALREIPVRTVRLALQLLQFLGRHQLGESHLELIFHHLSLLSKFGLTGNPSRVSALLELACQLEASGMSVVEWEALLATRGTRPTP